MPVAKNPLVLMTEDRRPMTEAAEKLALTMIFIIYQQLLVLLRIYLFIY